MARGLKLGKRLKNPFHKRPSASSTAPLNGDGGGHDDCGTAVPLAINVDAAPLVNVNADLVLTSSTESGGGSLNSASRDHGPIDSDTCRRYKRNGSKGRDVGGKPRAPSAPSIPVAGSRRSRRSSRSRSRDKRAARKSELPKIAESPSCTPSNESGALAGQAPRAMDAVSDSCDCAAPTGEAGRDVPIGDIFEEAAHLVHFDPDASLGGCHSFSTNGMLEEAECLINQFSADSSEVATTKATESPSFTITNAPLRRGEEEAANEKEQLRKPSPDNAVQLFEAQDPPRLDLDRVQSLPQPPPLPLRDLPSKTEERRPKNSSSKANTSSASTAAASNRLSVVDTCNASSSPRPAPAPKPQLAASWDPLTYTSLNDAMAAHAAMLTADVHGVTRGSSIAAELALADCSSSATASVASAGHRRLGSGAGVATTEPGGSARGFLALKKDSEKNEFKKLIFLKKNHANPDGVVSARDATRMTNTEPQENIELQALASLDAVGDAANSTSAVEIPPLHPPGLTPSTVSQDTEEPSVSPRKETLLPPQPSQGHAATSIFAVDVIQSFSLDQDSSLVSYEQCSLSDDSYSYLSELESIGDITICDETKRLLDAHRAYVEDAKTNANHPNAKRKSIMKVGSQLQPSLQIRKSVDSGLPMLSRGREQQRISSPHLIPESKLITWYDNEINGCEPFTLRTDESFDYSTVTTTLGNSTTERGDSVRMAVEGKFFGDLMQEIGKYTNCGGREDVASFQAC